MKMMGDGLLRELGREKSESYRALYSGLGWFLTVALAFLMAFANKLSSSNADGISIPYLWVVAIAISFTMRYYSRALLDYINMQSWSRLFNAYTLAWAAEDTDKVGCNNYFWELHQELVIKWQSPVKLRKAIFDTIRIGFGHLFLLEFGVLAAICWRLRGQVNLWDVLGPILIVVGSAIYEYRGLNYRRFEYIYLPPPPNPAPAATPPAK